MTSEQQKQLAERVIEADDPNWYLELFGEALESVGGEEHWGQALRVADQLYDEQPLPPPSEEDAELRDLHDALAADAHDSGDDPADEEAAALELAGDPGNGTTGHRPGSPAPASNSDHRTDAEIYAEWRKHYERTLQ